MKTFFPSSLGMGPDSASGPDVNCVGSPFFGNSQMLPCDENKKCFPFAVHTPQHSAAGLCHPASNSRDFPPSNSTSHNVVAFVVKSLSVTLSNFPSGDHCIPFGHASRCANNFPSVPSLFARNRSFPFAYTNRFPSRDHAPACPIASPSLRGNPPSTGNAHIGPSNAVPGWSDTSSDAPSSLTFNICMLTDGAASGTTSPPLTDTCPIEDVPAATAALYCKYSRAPSVPANNFARPSFVICVPPVSFSGVRVTLRR